MMTTTRPRRPRPSPPALLRICWGALGQTLMAMQQVLPPLALQRPTCSACWMTPRPVSRLRVPGRAPQHRPPRMPWCAPPHATSSAHIISVFTSRMVPVALAQHDCITWQAVPSAALQRHNISVTTPLALLPSQLCAGSCASASLYCLQVGCCASLGSACRSPQCLCNTVWMALLAWPLLHQHPALPSIAAASTGLISVCGSAPGVCRTC